MPPNRTMRPVAGSVLVYSGLAALVLGLVALVVGIPSTALPPAAVLLLSGIVLLVAACVLPSPTRSVSAPRTRLDDWLPEYQFHEVHSIDVAAAAEPTFRAIQSVTAPEIRLFSLLVWIRRFGRATAPGILNPPDDEPILDVAARTGFAVLADEPPREVVVGVIVIGRRGSASSRQATREDVRTALEADGRGPSPE